MEFLKKLKVKTVATGVLVLGASIYGGKKLIEHIQSIGEPEPLTDEELCEQLGIGTNVYYDEREEAST